MYVREIHTALVSIIQCLTANTLTANIRGLDFPHI